MLSATTLVVAAAAEFGTAEETKAMLEKAVAAVKEDKAKALDLFNTGEGGFKDRDGAPFGETIVQNATDEAIKQTTYWWPRPGAEVPLEKTALYTKVGDQICGVGFYKD
jgi:hypothetical protein